MSKFKAKIIGEIGGRQKTTDKILKVKAKVRVIHAFLPQTDLIYEDLSETHPRSCSYRIASFIFVCMPPFLGLTVNSSKINIIQYL